MGRDQVPGGADIAADDRYRRVFDGLFERGREAVLSGAHFRDCPPVEGGRWGLSVVLLPDVDAMARLAAVTAEALSVAGVDHWPTGFPGAVHFTVRAIQTHRAVVADGDALVARCAAALRRAAAVASGPVWLRLGGLTLTPSGIMACAYPVGSTADGFAARLGVELGEDGWFETDFGRDIWYATLVHFTGPILNPSALVEWVRARRGLDLGVTEIAGAELLRFAYDGRQPVRVALAGAALAGVLVSRGLTGQ